jgi:hypothetical protein
VVKLTSSSVHYSLNYKTRTSTLYIHVFYNSSQTKVEKKSEYESKKFVELACLKIALLKGDRVLEFILETTLEDSARINKADL